MPIKSKQWGIIQEDIHGLGATMSYLVSSRAAWAIKGVNKQKENLTKKKKGKIIK